MKRNAMVDVMVKKAAREVIKNPDKALPRGLKLVESLDRKKVNARTYEALHTVLDETRLTLEDLSWVVCHQANSRIIDHCIKALQADPAKFYKNMDRHGNTSAASIPVALNELAESGQLTPGRPLACIGFGGGLTWGGAILQYKE